MRSLTGELRRAVRRVLETVTPRLALAAQRRVSHEPELDLLPALVDRGLLALDIGANDGVYADRLAGLAREVLAFEPNRECCRFLRRALAGRVRLEEVALSDREGRAELRVPRYRYGHATMSDENTLAGLAARDEILVVAVPTRRLDDYGLRDVGFIKLDVEGFEDAVLRGARATLAAWKPNLLVEIEERHRRDAVGETARFLADLGYDGHFLRDGALRPLSSFVLSEHQRIEDLGDHARYVNNFIFLPRGSTLKTQVRGVPVGMQLRFE
jgi:FkbM family methyltransferase